MATSHLSRSYELGRVLWIPGYLKLDVQSLIFEKALGLCDIDAGVIGIGKPVQRENKLVSVAAATGAGGQGQYGYRKL